MILGPACSTATQAVAGTAHYWNLVTVGSFMILLWCLSSITKPYYYPDSEFLIQLNRTKLTTHVSFLFLFLRERSIIKSKEFGSNRHTRTIIMFGKINAQFTLQICIVFLLVIFESLGTFFKS